MPATAMANHGTSCSYTSGQAILAPVPGTGIVVYGGSGMSGQATAAVGVCAYDPTTVGFTTVAGGTVEAGAGDPAGSPGAYAIEDGDNANVDPTGHSDGYVGVSNFETGTKGDCTNGGGTGTNSGGCFSLGNGFPVLPIPLIACGDTVGNTWDNTSRDGCNLNGYFD